MSITIDAVPATITPEQHASIVAALAESLNPDNRDAYLATLRAAGFTPEDIRFDGIEPFANGLFVTVAVLDADGRSTPIQRRGGQTYEVVYHKIFVRVDGGAK